MIVFVRSWDVDARAVRDRYVVEVEGPAARAHERIARARFSAFGLEQYPDATFSPRITYGQVEGWSEESGRVAPAFTRADGLYERATGNPPFRLSQRWIDARNRIDANTIINVSTSSDVIGGNSGSPLLDREGRVVGAVFDGNIHSLGGEYFYDGRPQPLRHNRIHGHPHGVGGCVRDECVTGRTGASPHEPAPS